MGYGAGAIAVINTKALRKIGEVPLDGHPEGFQIPSTSNHIYVNVPDAQQIVIADRALGHVVRESCRTWSTRELPDGARIRRAGGC